MNDEIKLWKEKTKGVFHIIEYRKFWNYITNLQQENERLKEWKEDLLKENIELEDIRKEAIEYIKHAQNYGKEKTIYVNGDDLLNILQNGSDKE